MILINFNGIKFLNSMLWVLFGLHDLHQVCKHVLFFLFICVGLIYSPGLQVPQEHKWYMLIVCGKRLAALQRKFLNLCISSE